MPKQVQLRLAAAQLERILAALAETDYTQDLAGYKAMLIAYTREFVRNYERSQARTAALAAVEEPADWVIM